MKITRLHKAKDYRIFRDFTWPAGIPDFARFNVIYGWNGAGKTSLSNVFRQIQLRSPLNEGQVEIFIDKTLVSGANFDTAPLPKVLTFNRDTVDRNIFETANQQLPPVFFLGEESVEKQKRIEELKKKLADHIEAESRLNRNKKDVEVVLDSFCAEEAKGIKNLLTVAGGGPYNNYNAANFKSAAHSLISISAFPEKLTDKQRQAHLAIKDSNVMEKVSEPTISFPDIAALTSRTQNMLGRSVVSSVVDELAENPNVAAWVSTGLGLHRGDQLHSKCRFCDQLLPDQRILKLEAHFNDEFKRFQADVDALVNHIKSARDFITALRAPPKEALYTNLRETYEKALDTLNQQSTTVNMSIDILLRALTSKRDNPFKSLELTHFVTNATADTADEGVVKTFFQIVVAGFAALSAAMGKTAFDQMREIIEQHNKRTASFDAEVKKARAALAQDEVLKALPEWQKKSKVVTDIDDETAKNRASVSKLKAEIEKLEIQVLQHRRPAEELNQEVAAYLGRDELRFVVEQSGYRIMRGEHPATHLSDGERTAIAFLYFLKSLQDKDFDLKTGIVVIDDPVSSLDANSLFSAFGFMKQRTETAGQIFVLTHNFTFFRQVRNWFYHLPAQQKKDSRFYMLATEFVGGKRTAKLDNLDPFLHQYESEYHYLFKRVHEEAHKSATSSLEANYAIPNIARRLLESFLAFRAPDKSGELFQKLQAVDYDVAKKTRILRFLHTYSHFDQIAELGHDPSILSETPAVLQDVLALICKCDPGHFKSMSDLITKE